MVVKKRDWETICRQCAEAIKSGEYDKTDFAERKHVPRNRLYREMKARGL
jgi:hypothetical protein